MKFARFLPVLLTGRRAAAQDILDVANDAGLSTLLTALKVSGLEHKFDKPFWCGYFPSWCGEYTVFAPTEAAFAGLSAGTLERLLTDDFAPHLKDLLAYHAVDGAVRSGDIGDGDDVATLNGETVAASVDQRGAITLNGDASVVTADVEASNGVVHVVDRVLLPASATSNIAEVAAANGLDTLVALLSQVDLASFVSDPDKKLTVFAPTEEAFAALVADGFDASDDKAVADLLKYHVVEGSVVTQWELLKDRDDLVTVQGSPISVGFERLGRRKELKLNGEVGIAAADVLASNGIVHVVDRVLTPPAPLTDDIVAVASDNPDFSTLVEALAKADLVATLQGEGPFTVFAPTNAAFEKAGIVVDDLTSEQLAPVLLYHVLAGRVLEDQVASGIVRTNPLAPTNLLVDVRKSWFGSRHIRLNGGARVTSADVLASNGVVHVIDDVLLPPANIADLAGGVPDLSTLAGLLGDAGLASVLAGDGPFTVFAPSNDAFARLGDPGLTPEQLKSVLLYHVAAGNVPSSALPKRGDVDTLFAKGGDPQTVDVSVWWRRVHVKGDANAQAATVTTKDVLAANGVVHVIDEVLLPDLA